MGKGGSLEDLGVSLDVLGRREFGGFGQNFGGFGEKFGGFGQEGISRARAGVSRLCPTPQSPSVPPQDVLTVVVEDLRLCTVKPCEDIERRFCFEVVSPTK